MQREFTSLSSEPDESTSPKIKMHMPEARLRERAHKLHEREKAVVSGLQATQMNCHLQALAVILALMALFTVAFGPLWYWVFQA